MTAFGFLAVGAGGALGCWLRWLLGIALNPLFPNMLMGTLAANLTGGYLIGMAVEYFVHHDSLPPELPLFVLVVLLRSGRTDAEPRTRVDVRAGRHPSARVARDDVARHIFDAFAPCLTPA